MPLCPRCRSEGEWVSPDSGALYTEESRPVDVERLLAQVDEDERWKLPSVGGRFDPPPVPDGVAEVECSLCGTEYDPGEEPLPIAELLERLAETDG